MSLIREPFRLILAGDASSEDRELNKIGHCKVGLPSPPAPLPKERGLEFRFPLLRERARVRAKYSCRRSNKSALLRERLEVGKQGQS